MMMIIISMIMMMMILLVCYNNTFKSRHRAAFGLGFVLFCTSMVSGYLLHQVIFLLIAVRPTVFLIFFPIYKYKRPHDHGLAAVSTIFPQDDLAAWVSWLRFPSPQYWAAHPILERELGPVIVIILIISTSLFFIPGFKSLLIFLPLQGGDPSLPLQPNDHRHRRRSGYSKKGDDHWVVEC